MSLASETKPSEASLAEVTQQDAPIGYGIVQPGPYVRDGIPVLAIRDLGNPSVRTAHRSAPSIEAAYRRSRVREGDILVSVKGSTGKVGIVPQGFEGNISRDVARVRLRDDQVPAYWIHLLESAEAQRTLQLAAVGSTRQELSIGILRTLRFRFPPKREQAVVASVLGDATELIASLERLLIKKRAVRQAMSQQLLTGRTRLPPFSGNWETARVSDVLRPRSERNAAGAALTVLTCTKHHGFVRSLDYFKSQVFSNDLSGYKLIRRGDIGYPANHIEEGSIGVQELEDVAVVSPIYVVMSPVGDLDTYFLQRLLRLDSYRQVFATLTNASVNRRGSLRWPAFSQVEVRLPSSAEQHAVAAVLRAADAEIAALERRLEKAKQVKQGMAQQLLTGKTRLPVLEAVA